MVRKADLPHIMAALMLLVGFALSVIWGFQIISGILMPLIFAIIFAVVLTPLQDLLLKYISNKVVCSLITMLLLTILLIGVIIGVVYLAVGEVVSITAILFKNITLPDVASVTDVDGWNSIVGDVETSIQSLNNAIPFIDIGNFSSIISEVLKNITPLLQELSSNLLSALKVSLSGISMLLFNFFIFLVALFFLLLDGSYFMKSTFDLLPITHQQQKKIKQQFSSLAHAWVFVSLIMAVLQGTLAGIGFAIAGAPSPVVWGIVSGLAAFIPFVGTAFVWAPFALIYLLIGKFWTALFLVIWGAVVVGYTDNIIRPFLLRGGVEIHPFILFIAVIGGIMAFGVPGVILGPIIVVFISIILYIYHLEFGRSLKKIQRTDIDF
jgi:predicted PurR-regulated permease PerM